MNALGSSEGVVARRALSTVRGSGLNRALALELALLSLIAATASAALALHMDDLGWSWDALNHHVYLGLIAENPRWHLDVIAANYQSYQYPYPYWPIYRLSQLNVDGAWVAATWSAFQTVMLLLPTWTISHRLLPAHGPVLHGVLWRTSACLLAFMSVVVLAALETTANDPLATVPLLWAIAIGLRAPFDNRRAFASAALWGVSTAFKLSNGLFIAWLLLWWWRPERPHWPLGRAVAIAAGAVLGFGLVYAPWGWQLWRATANPFYPLLTGLFGRG